MKNILQLIAHYQAQQKAIAKKIDPELIKLQNHIEIAKDLLYKLRLNIRKTKFKNIKDEVYFFKHIKPTIHADYILYSHQLNYQSSKPNSTRGIQKQYIKDELKKLESKKRKNIAFYKYYNHQKVALDHVYFFRKNLQLDLFATNLITSLDPEFYTSHDALAAEVIAYKLLTNFYKKEMTQLNRIETVKEMSSKYGSTDHLNWTASKTDLIELIYALKMSGTINSGSTNIKDLAIIFSKLFNIQLPNVYKTYSEIKHRNNPKTKFLQNLADNLNTKLDFEDGF
jgi:hypothetical protein